MKDVITYKDLSIMCKLAFIGGWASLIIFGLSFMYGFMS